MSFDGRESRRWCEITGWGRGAGRRKVERSEEGGVATMEERREDEEWREGGWGFEGKEKILKGAGGGEEEADGGEVADCRSSEERRSAVGQTKPKSVAGVIKSAE